MGSRIAVQNFILFGVLYVCLGVRSDPSDEGLRNFVRHTMFGFQDWIIEEGLDPMPPQDINLTLSLSTAFLTLSGEIGNISNLGLSTRSYAEFLSPTSFANEMIDFELNVKTGGLSGNYNATGIVDRNYPISGNSWWRLTSTNFWIQFKEKFYLEGGYIRLNESYLSTSGPEIYFDLPNLTGSFNELLNPNMAPYEVQVLRTIARHIEQLTVHNYLFYSVFYRYLQEAFSLTPVTDIITWPRPTTTQRPTTTRPTTQIQTLGHKPTYSRKIIR